MSSSQRARFLDPKAVEEAIAEVAVVAERDGLDVAIIGGVAMMFYGSDRLTKDVDVASVDLYPSGLKVVKHLSFGGVAVLTSAGHPVGVVVREDEYRDLYREAVDRSVDVGMPIKVVTPEYLAALKMAAAREKDVLDLRKLIALGAFDRLEARLIVRRQLGEFAARELDALFVEDEWRRSRGE